jgi:hypothetical protein
VKVTNMEIISKKMFYFPFKSPEEPGCDVPTGYLSSHEIIDHNNLQIRIKDFSQRRIIL